MAAKDKPYKLYKGGRTRGPVRPLRESLDGGDGKRPKTGGEAPQKPRRRRRWRRIVLLVVLGLIVFLLVWGTLGYLAVNRGVKAANERLPDSARAALSEPNGSILTTPQNTLLLGADNGGAAADRQGTGRSDSIMIVRTDPDSHKLTYLSIPRDLYVEIPGNGSNKINAAYAFGGPALAIETVQNLTGIPINHVDRGRLRDVPVRDRRRRRHHGEQPDTGALEPVQLPVQEPRAVHAVQGLELREGRDRAERPARARLRARSARTSSTRARATSRAASASSGSSRASRTRSSASGGFFRMPFIGDDVTEPLAMDLSTNELLQMSWVRWRSSNTLRCRLGGTPTSINGASVIQSSEDNARVVDMVTNPDSAPQPPPKGQPFAPGCFVGRAGG